METTTIIGIVIMIVCIALVVIGFILRRRAIQQTYEMFREKDNSYSMVIEGFDWGPAVTGLVLNPQNISALTDEDLKPENWKVSCKWKTEEREREIKDITWCNIDGSPYEDGDERHILIKFRVHPDQNFFSPFEWKEETIKNYWKTGYEWEIQNEKCGKINVFNDWILPQGDKFDIFETRNSLKAACWAPENEGPDHKKPLIVWLHGAAEGGSDVTLPVLGNRVTALIEKEIQSYFDGAFVLVPQCPTYWMQHGSEPYDIMKDEVADKSSRWTEELKQVIDSFIKKNPGVDENRIYIGGCSNGGYMTVNMILKYPKFFAAGFPICQAYYDKWISDEDIKTIDRLPLWFVHAKNDQTIKPEETTVPLVRRLLEARSGFETHFSYFDDVHDTSGEYLDDKGNPVQYCGHWSWIYALNDQCSTSEEKSLWGWMARQKKV